MWPLLGLFELIFFGVFFILLVVGASFDRRGREEPKWYIFGIGLIIVAAWFWSDWTFAGAWAAVTSWTFWEPVGAYLLAGLVYSLIEFVLDVRRSARKFKSMWERHLSRSVEVKQLDDKGLPRVEEGRSGRNSVVVKNRTVREVLTGTDDPSNAAAASDLVQSFVQDTGRPSYGFVGLKVDQTGLAPEPLINKVELAEHIGAWTFFWPAYAVSLVLGDLLTEIFNWLADALVQISGRFVRMSFSDVFKF